MSDVMREPGEHGQSDTDLEYDLAHEVSGENAPPAAAWEHIAVPTETPGYAGDYSYDLAHDVPRDG